MSKGQKKRRVGVGMKPRGVQGDTMQKATMGVDTASGSEGQTEIVKVPESEPQQQEQRGPTLEAKNDVSEEVEKVSTVAAPPTEDAVSDLQKALEMSAEKGPEAVHIPTLEEHEKSVEEGRAIRLDDPRYVHYSIAEIEAAMNKGASVSIAPDGKVNLGGTLGPRPDGSHGIVLTVPEGYWEAVQQWAESEGISPEEWCNMRFVECIEVWGQPAKGR